MRLEDRRLALGLLLSLTIHALLFSLTFSGQGLGLPGFGFPWQARRAEVPDIRAVLLPAAVRAEETLHTGKLAPPLASPVTPLPAAEPAMLTLVAPRLPPKVPLAATAAKVKPRKVSKPKTVAPAPVVSAAPKVPAPTSLPAAQMSPEPAPIEDVLALPESAYATWAVPPAPELATPVGAADAVLVPVPAPAASAPIPQVEMPHPPAAEYARAEAQRQAEQAEAERQQVARQLAVQIEAARREAAQQEAAKQEAALKEAVIAEAERAQAARQEAAKQEAAKQEAVRAEVARAEASRREAVRQATALQEAARQEAIRAEAARAEAENAAKAEAARLEAPRIAAARIEAARLAALQADAEKREERLRAIGRQLNEEADRRDAAEAAARRSPSASTLRRGRLFGHTDPQAELVLYAEAWSRKIQLNMTFDTVREAAKQPHTRPLVTVAIRSDGSVESVAFVSSSGVPAIDEAIRQIVKSQAPYPAFSPALLREYDVVEIRRTWHFDMAIRLY